jgi:hypothetical protein
MAPGTFLDVVKRPSLREEESRLLIRLYIRLNIHESYYKALNRVK